MCLHKRLGAPEQKEGIGWKVLYPDNLLGRYMNVMQGIFGKHEYRECRWETAIHGLGSYDQAEPGFHIFTHLVDAAAYRESVSRSLVVKMVAYRHATLHGEGDGCETPEHNRVPVVVAQQMFILPDPPLPVPGSALAFLDWADDRY